MTAPQIFQRAVLLEGGFSAHTCPYVLFDSFLFLIGFLLVRRNMGKRRAAADQMNFAAEESAAEGSKVDDE
ncbi:putative transporter [Colletotrichum higginsianum]|nr:putative transporter [Colletotrichum higginsianum]